MLNRTLLTMRSMLCLATGLSARAHVRVSALRPLYFMKIFRVAIAHVAEADEADEAANVAAATGELECGTSLAVTRSGSAHTSALSAGAVMSTAVVLHSRFIGSIA